MDEITNAVGGLLGNVRIGITYGIPLLALLTLVVLALRARRRERQDSYLRGE